MNTKAVFPKIAREESARVETIDTKRTIRRCVRRSTGMNQHIKAAVVRLTCDSELEISRLQKIAEYANTTERQALDVLRDYIYDLRAAAASTIRPGSGGLRTARA